MKRCSYCGYSNYDDATECRKCDASFVAKPEVVYKSFWVGPEKARSLRGKALTAVVLGLMIKVYWGGYGPWHVLDNPTLAHVRSFAEPLLIYGGAILYLVGWVLNWI
ncbi:MAG: hypothetical protein DMG23_09485 [Acidobacteria bacterium]|nr:MAG: hypothetical protein DMG23_09485 [Acidobacteriota bacterium]